MLVLINYKAFTSQPVDNLDRAPPTFTANRTGINTIVLTFNEDVDTGFTDGTGWSVPSPGRVTANTDPNNDTTMILTTTEITGTTATPTVTYSATAGDVVDRRNNEIVDGANAVATDSVGPTISFVSMTPVSGNTAKVGDPITIIVRSDDGEDDLAPGTNTPTINGVDASFTDNDDNTYSFTITVSEGDSFVSDTSDALTVNLILNDANGNVGTPITEISASNAPGIDADSPAYSVITVTPASDNIAGIGDSIEIVIQADNNEEGLVFTSQPTINGLTTSTTDGGGGRYTIIAQIVEGGTDILDTAALPVNIQLQDAAGNPGELIQSIDADTAPGVDANSPEIIYDSITGTDLTNNIAGVGDTITITVNATNNEGGLRLVSTSTINGVTVNSFTPRSSGQYDLGITILEGGNDISVGTAIPTNIQLQDAGENPSNVISGTTASEDSLGIDANIPMFASAAVSGSNKIQVTINEPLNFVNIPGDSLVRGGNPVDHPSFSLTGTNNFFISASAAGNIITLTTNRTITASSLGISHEHGRTFISDVGDNRLSAFTNRPVSVTDTFPPVLTIRDLAPLPDQTVKIGDPITVSILAQGQELGLTTVGTPQIRGQDATFSSFSGGLYKFSTVITEGSGDLDGGTALSVNIVLQDSSGNSATITEIPAELTPAIDATRPVVSIGSAFSSDGDNRRIANIGDRITVNVVSGPVEDNLTIVGTPTIGGLDAGVTNHDNGTYSITTTNVLTEGAINVGANEALTVNILFQDAAGNSAGTPIDTVSAGAAPIIDTALPTITSASVVTSNQIRAVFSEPIRKSGSDIGFTVTYGRTSAEISSIDTSGNIVTINLTSDILLSSAVPTTLSYTQGSSTILDVPGNALSSFDNTGVLYDDLIAPEYTVTDISPSGRAAKVGDTLNVTVSTNPIEFNLLRVDSIPIQINGKDVISFSDEGDGDYTFAIEIEEGDPDVPTGSLIPISFTLQDSNNNVGNTLTTIPSSFNHPGIDANTPRIAFQGLSACRSWFCSSRWGD